MKYLSVFLFVFLIFSGCKKEGSEEEMEEEVCEMNHSALSINYQSWGTIKHPISDGIFFSNSDNSISPSLNVDGFIEYTNISISIDGGAPLVPEPGLSSVTVDSISAGVYTITMNLECEKRIISDEEVTCQCVGDETNAELEVEIINPVYVVFDSLIYSKNLPCTYDFPLFPCPDIAFNFSYYKYDGLYHIKHQYNYAEFGAMEAALNDTIAIYPSECILPLSIVDDDTGDDTHIEDYELNPDNMGGWNTGSYQVGPYLRVVITQL